MTRVAIVHDWLTGMRGGEKVLDCLCELFPSADLYTLLYVKGSVSARIESREIRCSFLQRLPLARSHYRLYLPLMPIAVEQFDLTGYDLVVSSSHCVAKGVLTRPETCHICYCYTPMRYAWDLYHVYFASRRTGWLARRLIPVLVSYLRLWDVSSASRVDHFVAISRHVAARIRKHYRRECQVIHPPVDTSFFQSGDEGGDSYENRFHPHPNPPPWRGRDTRERNVFKGSGDPGGRADYYLMVTAFAPYKRIDLAIEAFNRLGLPLVVVGSGQDERRLKARAGDNVRLLGWQSDERVRDLYGGCKAFIFPGEEDFGIAPIEAQAAGKPVIAYGRGGAVETVVPLNRPRDAGDEPWAARQGESSARSHQPSAPLSSPLASRPSPLAPSPSPSPTGIFFREQSVEALIEAVRCFEAHQDQFDPAEARKNALRFDRSVFLAKMRSFVEEKLQTH